MGQQGLPVFNRFLIYQTDAQIVIMIKATEIWRQGFSFLSFKYFRATSINHGIKRTEWYLMPSAKPRERKAMQIMAAETFSLSFKVESRKNPQIT